MNVILVAQYFVIQSTFWFHMTYQVSVCLKPTKNFDNGQIYIYFFLTYIFFYFFFYKKKNPCFTSIENGFI